MTSRLETGKSRTFFYSVGSGVAQQSAVWLNWVRRGSAGSALGCCKAAPRSNLVSTPQWRSSNERTAMRKLEELSELNK